VLLHGFAKNTATIIKTVFNCGQVDGSVRYRVVLLDTSRGFEAVIFRDFPETSHYPKGITTSMRSVLSINEAYQKVSDELKDQNAFLIRRIEEVPEEF
jgi:hypothetical protein